MRGTIEVGELETPFGVDVVKQKSPLTDRLVPVLANATGVEPIEIGWGAYVPLVSGLVQRVFLRDTGEGAIEVSFMAGDTLTQARELYNRPDVIARIRALAQRPGWDVGPNFHFGARVDGRCHTRGPIRLEEYLDLWQKRIDGEYSRPREEWDQYWNKMVELGVINHDDRSEFDKWFTNTRQLRATPRPGVIGSRRWPIEQAEELDAQGRFTDDVTEAIRVVLRTCGALVESSDRSVGEQQRTIESRGEVAEADRDRRIVAEVAARRQAAGKPWTAEMEARMLAERAERRRSAG